MRVVGSLYLDDTTIKLNNSTATGATNIVAGVSASGADMTITLPLWSTTFLATAATSITLPTTGTLATLAGAEALTNKTLTSPKINENVALTTTSTILNLLTSAAGTTGTTSTNIVFSTSPTLVTPVLGAATATTINGLTITTSASGVLTIAASKTLSVSNTLTFTGTDSSSVAFGAGGTVAYTDVATLSSLTSVGTIATGVWQGTVIGSAYGGTGINNTGSLTYGANNITLTTSGITSLTLPTSGTLVNSAVATLSSLTTVGALNSGSITSGFGAIDIGADALTAGTTTVAQLINSGLTADTVPYANASKQLTSSAVTPTELGYVSGVTAAIQTQMNLKAPLASPTFTGTVTLAALSATTSGNPAYNFISTSGNSTIKIDAFTGNVPYLYFDVNGTNKWRLYNNTDDSFNIYSTAGTIHVATATAAGAWTLGPSTANNNVSVNGSLTTQAAAAGSSYVHIANGYQDNAQLLMSQTHTANGRTWAIKPRMSSGFTSLVFASSNAITGNVDGDTDYTSFGSIGVAGAWTLGPAGTLTHTVNGGNLIIDRSDTGTTVGISLRNASVNQRLLYWDDNTARFYCTDGDGSDGVYIADGATTWTANSDIRMKKNVETLSKGLTEVLAIRPVSYQYNTDSDATAKRIGFIAQELEPLVPEAVQTSEVGMWGVSSTELIPVMLKAIQELSAKNDALEARLASLESLI